MSEGEFAQGWIYDLDESVIWMIWWLLWNAFGWIDDLDEIILQVDELMKWVKVILQADEMEALPYLSQSQSKMTLTKVKVTKVIKVTKVTKITKVKVKVKWHWPGLDLADEGASISQWFVIENTAASLRAMTWWYLRYFEIFLDSFICS